MGMFRELCCTSLFNYSHKLCIYINFIKPDNFYTTDISSTQQEV